MLINCNFLAVPGVKRPFFGCEDAVRPCFAFPKDPPDNRNRRGCASAAVGSCCYAIPFQGRRSSALSASTVSAVASAPAFSSSSREP